MEDTVESYVGSSIIIYSTRMLRKTKTMVLTVLVGDISGSLYLFAWRIMYGFVFDLIVFDCGNSAHEGRSISFLIIIQNRLVL